MDGGNEMTQTTPTLEVLTELLMGEASFFPDTRAPKVFFDRENSQQKGGVMITPLYYPSRKIPVSFLDGKTGKIRRKFRRDHISALLLEKEGENSPKRNVIALHQHALNFEIGKSEPAGLKGDPEQAYGFELAQRGYRVLCFDFPPFEERILDFPGEPFLKQELSLEGVELMGKYMCDTMRAVDVLLSLNPNPVNPEVGLIGHSLGGMVAVYTQACDPRITAAVANCGVSTYDSITDTGQTHNWAYPIHGMRPRFGEWHEVFAFLQGRPLLISASFEDDLFPIEGVVDFVRFAKKFEGASHLKFKEWRGGHSFSKEAREFAYGFLDRHLERGK